MDVSQFPFILDVISKLKSCIRWIKTYKCRRFFGNDTNKEYHIIYTVYNSPDRRIVFPKIPPKVSRKHYASGAKNLTTIHSCATTISAGYLNYVIGKNIGIPPILSSDEETDENMDLSFLSIGGLTNYKTVDLLEDESNNFLDFNENGLIISKDPIKRPLNISYSDGYDYSFIIKIHPKNNPGRTWMCCAGIGEWGTSGAAWYLANRWKQFYKFVKKKEFAYITKTRIGSDTSTHPILKLLKDSNGEIIVQNIR